MFLGVSHSEWTGVDYGFGSAGTGSRNDMGARLVNQMRG